MGLGHCRRPLARTGRLGALHAFGCPRSLAHRSKVRQSLVDMASVALTSKDAVVLGQLGELEARAEELEGAVPPQPTELPELRTFLQRYEFKSMEKKLFPWRPRSA